MPQVFRVSGYLVFLWTNEGEPLEPIHFHITDGVPSGSCTKVWLTSSGHCLLCHNRSRIPEEKLRRIMMIAEARHGMIEEKWREYFGSITYYV